MIRTLAAGTAILASLTILSSLAWAAAETTVDYRPLLQEILAGAVVVLTGLVGWAIQRLAAWLRLRQDSEIRAYLEGAAERAIAYGQARVQERIGRLDPADVRSELVAAAVGYLISRVPDALRRFGLGSDELRDFILARLPPGSTGST